MKSGLFTLLFLFFGGLMFAQTANVQVLHNSPTPGTDAGPVVDIYVNGGLLPQLTGVPFRAATGFLPVPAGVDIEVAVAVSPSNSVDDAIATFPLGQLADGANYTVIASGIVGDMNTPFNLFVNGQAQTSGSTMDNVDFNVFHGSPDAPNVDIDIRLVGNVLADFPFGSYSPYLSVTPDKYYVDVRAAGDDNIVATFEADLSGLAGGSATVFASGMLANTPAFGLFALLGDGTVIELPTTAMARVQVIHNSPSPSVDIYANGNLLLDDFEYRTATPYVFLPAGVAISLAVAPSTSTSVNDAIATFDGVQFNNGETYTVIANGIVGNPDTPFKLTVSDIAREASVDPNNVDLKVFHGSPNAPAVDVGVRGLGNVIDGLAYDEFSGYLGVPGDNYYFEIRPNGAPDLVATFNADLTGLEGNSATVFASGLLGDDPAFGLFAALGDGTVLELTATAQVQVIHNSPSPTVDIYANGGLLLDNFAFRTATPYVDLPTRVGIDLAVAPENSTSVDDAIATFNGVTFEDGKVYTVFANGIVGDMNNPFKLTVSDGARTASADANNVDLNVFHGSPGAPAVDVDVRGIGNVIDGLAYDEFSGYLGVPGDNYYFEIRADGSTDLVATFNADLTGLEGNTATVFASGILGNDPAFGLFAALGDGTVLELTATAQVQVIHNSPSPTVDIYANGGLLLDNFAFRTATPYVDLPTRVGIDLAVAPENSTSVNDAIATFNGVTFEDGKVYTVFANGIVGDMNNPFKLTVSDGARTASADANNVDLNVFHGSPGAPAVDVDVRGIGNVIDGLAYDEFSGYLGVPGDNYYFEIRADGSTDLVATFNADLTGLEGNTATVFASGILGNDPAFGLFAALADGTVLELTATARVQVIHNSPSPTVDIYANGDILLDDFAYRTATPFVDLPTRVGIDLAVAGENSQSANDAIANFDGIVLEDGKTYIIMATGIVGNADTPFNLNIFDQAQERAADGTGVDLLVYHGSTDAPEVDIVVAANGAVLIDDIEYGEFQGYANVPAASYDLNITPADDNSNVVASVLADLSTLDGGAATVFASGFFSGDDPSFEIWVALADGTTFPLSFIVNTNELERNVSNFNVFPNPTNTNSNISLNLKESMNLNMFVVNQIGQVVQSQNLGELATGEHNFTFDISNLNAGVYQLQLQSNNGIITRRIVVMD